MMMLNRILTFVFFLGMAPLKAEESYLNLQPYSGPHVKGVDTSTLKGKAMTGYQGWFNCEGDGANLGWTHWTRNRHRPFGPSNVTVDLWPDISEYTTEELFESEFRLQDGSHAKVFSSFKRDTVLRHYRWMREYGIDGAFVQRFANGLHNPSIMNHKNAVLTHSREGANRNGRAYAVMYDLSGLPAGGVKHVIEDWKMLRNQMQIGLDSGYLKHKGQPLVAVWGIGFNDGRKYTLAECKALIEFLKADGCSVMVGIPSFWRELKRDALNNPNLHEILKLADVISPWTPGRYRNPTEASRHGQEVWAKDIQWCQKHDLDYLPVVFPGFSWHHLNKEAPLDQIPRLKGQFLWSQFTAAKKAGAEMIYVAMFDEVDEATAIFKCTNEPPVGDEPFLTYEGLSTDHYLWLTGEAGRMLRGDRPATMKIPIR